MRLSYHTLTRKLLFLEVCAALMAGGSKREYHNIVGLLRLVLEKDIA
jgi:hypothetical protein